MNTTLLFGIHCHQPIDNFGWVFKDAIEKSYKPFFNILKEFPHFKISVHFSGSLFEFIEKNDKELFTLIKELSEQIEFFSGGYYEPVLASIPSNDRIGQITKLNKYIKKHFNQTPKGLWLTERVWDNAILQDIKKCGIKYVIVDDYHINISEVPSNERYGYFTTEEGGEQIGLFPINQDLRYAIPFFTLKDTNEILHKFKNEAGKNAAIIFDDGEKFGIWPKTYETVYEKEWLRKFFRQTLDDEEIKVETFNEYYKNNQPISLAYLPTASYFEMGEWSLNAHNCNRLQTLIEDNKNDQNFLRGATWKNFLTKYQESNWIQKRFLELSKKQTKNPHYIESLYKAQCNDVLWHGVFGGIYLPNLRDNAFKYIIKCEKLLNESKEKIDIDMDGSLEYKYKSDSLLTIISPKSGGQIMELDILDKNYNLQNTLTRYEEAYHTNIEVKETEEETTSSDAKEDEAIATIHDSTLTVDKEIFFDYDWYLKKSCIDHIVPSNITIEQFAKNSFREFSDFTNQIFDVEKSTKKKLNLKREGGIYLDKKYPTTLNKKFKLENNNIDINIDIQTNSKEEFIYLQEWNLHFANIEDVSFNGVKLDSQHQYSNLEIISHELNIYDKYLDKSIVFSFDKKIKIFVCSLNSISQSEQGVDITNQGVTIGFINRFKEKIEKNIFLTIS